jgi:S1-C subfamily serine protease
VRRWMKNCIIIASLLLVSCTQPTLFSYPPSADLDLDSVTNTSAGVEVHTALGDIVEILDAPHLSITEQRARRAAVKVRSLLSPGHGSGTYMIAYDRRVVVTAAHVVRSESVMAIDGRDGETVIGKVAFVDRTNDIALLVVPEMETRTAVVYRPQKSYDERLIGTRLTYTGFPSHHDLLTIRGYIAAIEHDMVVTNMFGWFGSSGSGVFDQRGRLVGVVSGIDVGNIGFRIPLESIVWVAPTSHLDHDLLRIRILTADTPDTLNAFPGARSPRRGGLRD